VTYFRGILKGKVYKTNPLTLKEISNSTGCEILTISGEGFQRVYQTSVAGVLSAFGQEDNIFSIFCNTHDFFIGFLNVINAAV